MTAPSGPPTQPSARSRSLVVLPTYDERENLESAVVGVLLQGYDVLVIDDNSPDGTGDLADRLATSVVGLQVLHRSRKLGLGSAYVTGFEIGLAQGYEFILEMDADGSHLHEDLNKLIDAARRSDGVSIGSRYVPGGGAIGWSMKRRVLSKVANFYCRALLGGAIHDWTSGFRCYSSHVLESVGLDPIVSDGFSFQIELAYRCLEHNVPVVEVPIYFKERALGKSKANVTEIRKVLHCVARLRSATSPLTHTRSVTAQPRHRSRKSAG